MRIVPVYVRKDIGKSSFEGLADIEPWNREVDLIKENLEEAQRNLDLTQENLGEAKKIADKIIDTFRKKKYHSKTGEDLKNVVYEKIKKEMSIDVDSLNDAISLQSVINVLHDHIQEKDDTMKQLDHEYNKVYDTYSLEKAFLIKLIFKNAQKSELDPSKRYAIVNFQIEDLKQHKDIEIIVDLDKKSIYHMGCADKLFEEELKLKFDYDYILNHIYVDMDKMPFCIQKELYEIKKQHLKKVKLSVKVKNIFYFLKRNKKIKIKREQIDETKEYSKKL